MARVTHEAQSIEPATFAELRALAKDASDSRFFGAESPAQALLVMMAGRDLGFSYTQALRAFHVIKGKPSLSADGMVAACVSRKDVCEYFRPVGATNDASATFATKRVGDPERIFTFTMEDAKRGELTGNPIWKKFPSRMLSARAKSTLAREVYPDILMGLYEPDEVDNFDRQRPAPGPVTVVEIDTTEVASALEQTLREARSESTLKAAGGAVKKAFDEGRLTSKDREILGQVYNECKSALKPKPVIVPQPIADAEIESSPEREPGAEG